MAINNSLGHLQKQEQKISVSMIQGLKMLALPTVAMYDYLVELSVGNPLLEIPEFPAAEVYESISPVGGSETPYDNGQHLYDDRDSFYREQKDRDRFYREQFYMENGRDPGYYDALPSQYDSGDDESYNPYYAAGRSFDADGLVGSLELQLSLCRLSPVEQAIGRDIIGDLDESGYFTGDLGTIALLYCQSIETAEKVLKIIQGFQPRGIAARDVYEALCLQVDEDLPFAALAKTVINKELASVSENLVAPCARRYKVTPELMSQVFCYIRSLEPRPGNCDCTGLNAGYIRPDIVVKKEGGELAVYVCGESANPLRLNEEYLSLMKQPDLGPEDRQYLRSCLNSARALIHSVDIRRQTMHKAALTLVSLQSDFFLYGPDMLHPLTMQQMADAMGVNVSTVSRIAQDKYVSSPWGNYPIKHFFVRTVKGTDNKAMSSAAAKQLIQQLISRENPAQPLTDEQISISLKDSGYCLSRRTVSKYRQEAGIPGCTDRRRIRSV